MSRPAEVVLEQELDETNYRNGVAFLYYIGEVDTIPCMHEARYHFVLDGDDEYALHEYWDGENMVVIADGPIPARQSTLRLRSR